MVKLAACSTVLQQAETTNTDGKAYYVDFTAIQEKEGWKDQLCVAISLGWGREGQKGSGS